MSTEHAPLNAGRAASDEHTPHSNTHFPTAGSPSKASISLPSSPRTALKKRNNASSLSAAAAAAADLIVQQGHCADDDDAGDAATAAAECDQVHPEDLLSLEGLLAQMAEQRPTPGSQSRLVASPSTESPPPVALTGAVGNSATATANTGTGTNATNQSGGVNLTVRLSSSMLLGVFRHLDCVSLARASEVCLRWYRICRRNEETLWRRLYVLHGYSTLSQGELCAALLGGALADGRPLQLSTPLEQQNAFAPVHRRRLFSTTDAAKAPSSSSSQSSSQSSSPSSSASSLSSSSASSTSATSAPFTRSENTASPSSSSSLRRSLMGAHSSQSDLHAPGVVSGTANGDAAKVGRSLSEESLVGRSVSEDSFGDGKDAATISPSDRAIFEQEVTVTKAQTENDVLDCIGWKTLFVHRYREANPIESKYFRRSIVPPEDLEPFGLRLCLYGAEGAGKTTLFKQMQYFYLHRQPLHHQPSFRLQIHACCLDNMQRILEYLQDQELLDDILTEEPLRAMARRVQKVDSVETTTLRRSIAQDIFSLWKLPKLRDAAFRRRLAIGLTNDAFFFLGETLRISLPGYSPTVEDVLRVHVPTTSVTVHTFPLFRRLEYHVVQLGGSSSQRRKLYDCCYDLDMFCFLVDPSTYDEKVPLRSDMTRLRAALDLFRQVCNNRWLTKTGVILVFNKRHLFEAKLRVRPLSNFFPQYRGTTTNEAMHFITMLFREAAEELACAHVVRTAWISATDSRSTFRFLHNLHTFLLDTAVLSAANPSVAE